MSKLFSIRPLKWRKNKRSKSSHAVASFGNYTVSCNTAGQWVVNYCFDEYYDEGVLPPCNTEEAAKAAAQKDLVKRLKPLLKAAGANKPVPIYEGASMGNPNAQDPLQLLPALRAHSKRRKS